MKHQIKITFILIFFTGFCFSQSIDTISLKRKAFKDYKACTKYYEGKNLEKYSKYVHPIIVKQIGKEKLLLENNLSLKNTKRSVVETGKIFFDNQVYQFEFTESMISEVNNIEKSNNYSVIAMSYDKGINWVFFNAYDSIERMLKDIPELNSHLKVKNVPKLNFQF